MKLKIEVTQADIEAARKHRERHGGDGPVPDHGRCRWCPIAQAVMRQQGLRMGQVEVLPYAIYVSEDEDRKTFRYGLPMVAHMFIGRADNNKDLKLAPIEFETQEGAEADVKLGLA